MGTSPVAAQCARGCGYVAAPGVRSGSPVLQEISDYATQVLRLGARGRSEYAGDSEGAEAFLQLEPEPLCVPREANELGVGRTVGRTERPYGLELVVGPW